MKLIALPSEVKVIWASVFVSTFLLKKSVACKSSNLSEVEIMHERGFYRIFDSGNILFKITL